MAVKRKFFHLLLLLEFLVLGNWSSLVAGVLLFHKYSIIWFEENCEQKTVGLKKVCYYKNYFMFMETLLTEKVKQPIL